LRLWIRRQRIRRKGRRSSNWRVRFYDRTGCMGIRFDLLKHGVKYCDLTGDGRLMIIPNKMIGEYLSEYD
jgi:hypothetical protein